MRIFEQKGLVNKFLVGSNVGRRVLCPGTISTKNVEQEELAGNYP